MVEKYISKSVKRPGAVHRALGIKKSNKIPVKSPKATNKGKIVGRRTRAFKAVKPKV